MRKSFAFVLLLFCLFSVAFSPTPAPEAEAETGGAPEAPVRPPPIRPPESNSGSSITQTIIHRLNFPAATISEALTNIFFKAAQKEARSMENEINNWSRRFAQALKPPAKGEYSGVARSSLPVAAGLAPALFLLRLALHHWQRLTGGSEGVVEVIGDWVSAGALAAASGPLLDLMVRLGHWATGQALGEVHQLSRQFVASLSTVEMLEAVGKATVFGPLVAMGMGLGAVLAVAGLFMAFAASTAALYILAVLAAPLAVIGVLPQMRWTRTLWLKAALIVSLIPLVAGGIFKAAMMSSFFFRGGGLIAPLVRILWLWGACGMLLSLATILSKVTLGAATDAISKLGHAVKGIVATAATAGAAGGVGAAAGAASAVGSASPPVGTGVVGGDAAAGHLAAAQGAMHNASTAAALGLNSPAQMYRMQAQSHQIDAQRCLLESRLARLGGNAPDLAGNSAAGAQKLERLQNGFGGNADSPQYQNAYDFLNAHAQQRGMSLGLLADYHPEEVGWMMRAYADDPLSFEGVKDALREAALRASPPATSILQDVYGDEDAA